MVCVCEPRARLQRHNCVGAAMLLMSKIRTPRDSRRRGGGRGQRAVGEASPDGHEEQVPHTERRGGRQAADRGLQRRCGRVRQVVDVDFLEAARRTRTCRLKAMSEFAKLSEPMLVGLRTLPAGRCGRAARGRCWRSRHRVEPAERPIRGSTSARAPAGARATRTSATPSGDRSAWDGTTTRTAVRQQCAPPENPPSDTLVGRSYTGVWRIARRRSAMRQRRRRDRAAQQAAADSSPVTERRGRNRRRRRRRTSSSRALPVRAAGRSGRGESSPSSRGYVRAKAGNPTSCRG